MTPKQLELLVKIAETLMLPYSWHYYPKDPRYQAFMKLIAEVKEESADE